MDRLDIDSDSVSTSMSKASLSLVKWMERSSYWSSGVFAKLVRNWQSSAVKLPLWLLNVASACLVPACVLSLVTVDAIVVDSLALIFMPVFKID